MPEGINKMKVLSIEFTPAWSWGLIFDRICEMSELEIDRVFINQHEKINTADYDVIMPQNITLLSQFKERLKTICRLGGNRSFDGGNLEPILTEMSKCFCVVATNKMLFDIAKAVHDKVYLIPNGIDLDEWQLVKRERSKPFTVGFCANITGRVYREYKGFDFVQDACNAAGVELKTALYKNEQIPHDKMRELFYSQIDCIIHPTLGEGCSNTLMEACACGVPIITTKTAGLHGEMMIDGKDVLFCERTAESIEYTIKKLMKSKTLQKKLSSGARQFAVKHHDVKEIVKQYDKIFRDCAESNKEIKQPKKVDKMKIKFTRSVMTNNGIARAGEIKELDDMEARMMIEIRAAEVYTAPVMAPAIIQAKPEQREDTIPAAAVVNGINRDIDAVKPKAKKTISKPGLLKTGARRTRK